MKKSTRAVLACASVLGGLGAIVSLFDRDSMENGFAFFSVVSILTVGMTAFALVRMDKKNRCRFFAGAMLALSVVSVLLYPTLCRVAVLRRLTSLGATVHCNVDRGDGVWFRSKIGYLPVWAKDVLGDAFFGPIKEIDFSDRNVPVEGLCSISYAGTVERINLNNTAVSGADLKRIGEAWDAEELLLNSTHVDDSVLPLLSKFPSLYHVALIDTAVHVESATAYLQMHSTPSMAVVGPRDRCSIVRPTKAQNKAVNPSGGSGGF